MDGSRRALCLHELEAAVLSKQNKEVVEKSWACKSQPLTGGTRAAGSSTLALADRALRAECQSRAGESVRVGEWESRLDGARDQQRRWVSAGRVISSCLAGAEHKSTGGGVSVSVSGSGSGSGVDWLNERASFGTQFVNAQRERERNTTAHPPIPSHPLLHCTALYCTTPHCTALRGCPAMW